MFDKIHQELNDLVWQWHEHNIVNNKPITLEQLIENSNLDDDTRAILLEKVNTPIDELIYNRLKNYKA
jgi:hypothetical protein